MKMAEGNIVPTRVSVVEGQSEETLWPGLSEAPYRREPLWWGSRIASVAMHAVAAAVLLAPEGPAAGGEPVKTPLGIGERVELVPLDAPVASRAVAGTGEAELTGKPNKLEGTKLGYTRRSARSLIALMRRLPGSVVGFRVEGDFGAMCPAVVVHPTTRVANGGRCVSEGDGFPIEVTQPDRIPELAEARRLAMPEWPGAVAVVVLPAEFGRRVEAAILARAGSLLRVETVVLDLSAKEDLGFRVVSLSGR